MVNILKEDPKTKKGKTILIISVALAGLVIGTGGGILFSYILKTPNQEMASGDGNKYADKYDVNELQNSVQKAISSGKDVTQEFSLSQIANYALDNFKLSENSVAIGYGKANSAVALDIRNFTIKNGDSYMEEALSKSAPGILDIRVCQRDYQTGTSEDSPIESYLGSLIDAEHATYDNPTKKDYTVTTYKDTFGKSVDDPSVYVVSSKTILTDTVTQTSPLTGEKITGNSNIKKVDGGYELYMELNTVKGVAKYWKRMMNLSGSNVSSFNYVHLTYYLNDNFELVKSFVEESYAAGMANINASVLGTLTTYFFKDTNDYKIPSSNESVSYPEEGKLR